MTRATTARDPRQRRDPERARPERVPRPRRPRLAGLTVVAPLFALALLLLLPAGVPAQEPASPVTLGKITIEPANPGPDTLCKLRVEIQNRGEKIASQFGFAVTINGQPLPVYRNQLYMFRVEPGMTAELRLYNFWTTETNRPLPPDGKLHIEVSLNEAEWKTIQMEGDEEVWRPAGTVPGLPVTQTLTVELAKSSGS